jgi:hypothetical protein
MAILDAVSNVYDLVARHVADPRRLLDDVGVIPWLHVLYESFVAPRLPGELILVVWQAVMGDLGITSLACASGESRRHCQQRMNGVTGMQERARAIYRMWAFRELAAHLAVVFLALYSGNARRFLKVLPLESLLSSVVFVFTHEWATWTESTRDVFIDLVWWMHGVLFALTLIAHVFYTVQPSEFKHAFQNRWSRRLEVRMDAMDEKLAGVQEVAQTTTVHASEAHAAALAAREDALAAREEVRQVATQLARAMELLEEQTPRSRRARPTQKT